MTEIKSSRTFQMWDYRVSHNQLLLRSPKDETYQQNHDIIFVGVEHLDIPSIFRGIEVTDDAKAEAALMNTARATTAPKGQMFALISNSRRYVVVATAMRDEQNDLDLFDSSLESFST